METILGIDLGTTNSAVSIIRDGKVEVLKEDGDGILPSVVGLDSEGRLLVGHPARNQWVLAPDRTVRSIKRRMGQDIKVQLGPREYAPQEISAMILRTLKERAERQLGYSVSKAVITVPAFFNETQREATREAGELAGLEVVRIINEPTAASLTYEPHPDHRERILVYDLGGGTFDCSIVQIEQGVVEVLSSHGDTLLGGDDFDNLLMNYVCDQFAAEHEINLRDSLSSKARVLRAVEEAKKQLSAEPVVRLAEEFIGEKAGVPLHLLTEISRLEYENMIEPLLDKTLKCVDESLSDAKLKAQEIDKVVLVGGSSRTPMVHRLLQEQLRQPLHFEVDPDLAVSMGAAIQGGLIAGIDVGPVLVDITPHTLGIECLGELHGVPTVHFFSPIIERNTALPASRTEMYYTAVDGQDAARIIVCQGENEDAQQNQHIGEFLLDGLSDVSAGNDILVKFHLDLDGILNVTATERATGLEKRLTISNTLSQFRGEGRAHAMSRLDDAFEAGQTGRRAFDDDAGSLPDAASQSPELKELLAKSEEVLQKCLQLSSTANSQDVEEIDELTDSLRTAIQNRSADEIRDTLAELEDLVFYLQDA